MAKPVHEKWVRLAGSNKKVRCSRHFTWEGPTEFDDREAASWLTLTPEKQQGKDMLGVTIAVI